MPFQFPSILKKSAVIDFKPKIPIIMFCRKKSYDSLYIDILKIGKKRIDDGLSYNDLIIKLKKKGYDLSGKNSCVELATRQWFFDTFHHRDKKDKEPDFESFKWHLDCNFIMKGEACLKLIDHKISKRNILAAWIAAVIALSALIYGIGHDWYVASTNKQKSQVQIPNQYLIPHPIQCDTRNI